MAYGLVSNASGKYGRLLACPGVFDRSYSRYIGQYYSAGGDRFCSFQLMEVSRSWTKSGSKSILRATMLPQCSHALRDPAAQRNDDTALSKASW
jgi:hypothetical protein